MAGKYIFTLLSMSILAANTFAASPVNQALTDHFNRYKEMEYFSGIALSTYVPKQGIKNYYIGQTSHADDSDPINEDTLFQIGSITKSFTSAIILQLEKEGKLHLHDQLQQHLPQYNKWAALTIDTLLNMTSGLPNYSDAPLLNAAFYQSPQKQWSDKELLNFVYPAANFNPPLKAGYAYTNTGYVLAGMMIEKLTQHTLQTEIETRLIQRLDLKHTYYPLPSFPADALPHLAHGYGFNPYLNPELVGRDITQDSLSWAGAAGAIISTPADVIKWVKALFIENQILDKQQQAALMNIVSTSTGKPIKSTTPNDPRGFGLGVIQATDPELGQYWYYEGETEGFRALYMYVPKTGIIISCLFNSAVNSENDHAGELMKRVYTAIRPH